MQGESSIERRRKKSVLYETCEKGGERKTGDVNGLAWERVKRLSHPPGKKNLLLLWQRRKGERWVLARSTVAESWWLSRLIAEREKTTRRPTSAKKRAVCARRRKRGSQKDSYSSSCNTQGDV